MMPEVKILGCFFHLAKAFKKRIDKKQMKRLYEENFELQKFVKQSIGLSALPLGDLEIGVQWLKDNVLFDDEKLDGFKGDFLSYIETYWVNGCFPPFVWNTWGRTDDYTNNNQEGYNSKMNKELKQIHLSPGILLCFLRDQIILNEIKMVEAVVGEPKPRQQVKYRKNKKKRTNLKINFEKAKRMRGVNLPKLVGEYLSVMGHNVITATMIGRNTELSDSQDPNHVIHEDESGDMSYWQNLDESVEVDIEEGENPYEGRKIGVTKRMQAGKTNPKG